MATLGLRLGLVLAAVLATVACSPAVESPPPSSSDAILAPYDLAELDARAVIDRLEATPVSSRASDLRASVRPNELQLSDQRTGASSTLALPGDVFYLAIAPYVNQTHECFYHSLTTCRGELSGQEIHVTVTRADGQVLVDENRATHDSGFVGLWLPRDIEATLRVEHAGLVSTMDIATGAEDATCLTTLQLG